MESGDGNHSFWKGAQKFRWIFTYFLGNILLYGARSTMSISLPAISEELGWDKKVSGMALSAFFCGYVCTNMIGGHMADRYGGELVIFYAGIGWSSLTIALPFVARMSLSFASHTTVVIFFRFLTGVSQGVFYPSMSAVTEKRVPRNEKGFFTGFVLVSGPAIGSAATGFFGSIILETLNWAYVFILVGSLALLWILWLGYLISAQVESIPKNDDLQSLKAIPFRQLLTSSAIWGLFVSYCAGSYCFLNMLSWAPEYFYESFPKTEGWLFNTIPWLVTFCLANFCGFIGNVMSRKEYSVTFIRKLFATLQLLSYCLCSFLLMKAKSFELALLLMSMNIAGNSFTSCSLQINAQDLVPEHAGALHGFINGSGAIAGVIGIYLTGYILKVSNKWANVFFVNGCVAFTGMLSFLIFGSGERVV